VQIISGINRNQGGQHHLPALIRLPDVKRLTGLSTTEIYRRIAEGRFPKQVPLGAKATAWVESEVRGWVVARIAERDTTLPRPGGPGRRRRD